MTDLSTYRPHVAEIHCPWARYDVIADVHGQADALLALLRLGGWSITPFDPTGTTPIRISHPERRHLILAGDMVNRGPRSDLVLRLLAGLIEDRTGHAVIGNHDLRLADTLRSFRAPRKMRSTVGQLRARGSVFASQARALLLSLPHQLRLVMPEGHPMHGDGVVSVVHAAAPASRLDKSSRKAAHRAINGFSAEEVAARPRGARDWADRYRGPRWILHGHTPDHGMRRRGRVIGLDTGAGTDGALSMFRLDSCSMLSLPVGLSLPHDASVAPATLIPTRAARVA